MRGAAEVVSSRTAASTATRRRVANGRTAHGNGRSATKVGSLPTLVTRVCNEGTQVRAMGRTRRTSMTSRCAVVLRRVAFHCDT